MQGLRIMLKCVSRSSDLTKYISENVFNATFGWNLYSIYLYITYYSIYRITFNYWILNTNEANIFQLISQKSLIITYVVVQITIY